jgi:ADP-ribosylglycohydrolase
MSDQTSSPDDRRRRILASALWAAYGDALGFIGELTDRSGLRRRASVDHVSTTVPWSRRIGGQFGPTVKLPAGTISDDTQLRLATCRSIRPTGAFDVETFSEIELTTWPVYALGAGRGSLAAAANLRKRDTTWATNFFNAKNTSYINGGGNGAAMRVQPHVWASPANAPAYSWLADVIVNSVCTHGHERGFVGAAFHAACLSLALTERRVPGPEDWLRSIDDLRRLPTAIREDDRLSEIWLRQWEKRSERSLETGVESALKELASDVRVMTSATPDQGRAAYVNGVEALKAFDPAQRGSGTKTSVLGALVAWVFADRPEEGLIVSADYLGTDTDSIATMAGAILGAAGAAPVELPGTVQDQGYLAREADRMWAAAAGLRPPRFPYPDVLSWRPPRSGMDGVAAEDDQLHLVGLGPGGAVGEPYVTEGKTPGVWQWLHLWFGQTVLAKRREHPTKLTSSHRVGTSAHYTQADLAIRPEPTVETGQRQDAGLAARSGRSRAEGDQRYADHRGRYAQPPLRTVGEHRSMRSLDEITDDVIKAGLTDAAIGAGLRELVEHERSIESGQAFAAIIVKALVTRSRQPRSS